MSTNKKIKYNTFIFSLYFWQYSLLVPFMIFVNPTIIVAVVSVILLFFYLIYNFESFIISKKNILMIMMIFLLLLVKYIQYPKDIDYLLLRLFNFLCIGIVSIIIVQEVIDEQWFWHYSFRLALFSAFFLVWIPLASPIMKEIGYMRFGYALVPVLNIFIIKLREKTKYNSILFLIYIVTLLESFIYGSRGSFFTHIGFLLLYFLCKNRMSFVKKSLLMSIAVSILFNIKNIIYGIRKLLSMYGIQAYAINKYIMQLERGFESASSGRDYIWEVAMQAIKESPILGNSISYVHTYANNEYYHNIFLEILAEFGIFIFFVFLAYFSISYFKAVLGEKKIWFIFFFSIVFGRLIFSSTLWERPEFWILVSMINTSKFKSTKS